MRKPYQPAKNQRLDDDLYKQANRVYFITIRSYRHQKPFLSDDMNQMIVDTLEAEQNTLGFFVYVYCLMPDHLHYLISPSTDGLSVITFANRFKGKTTNNSWKLGWSGKLWQPRFYDHIVRSDESLSAIGTYILHNPVRKELVNNADQWTWAGYINPFPDWLLS